MQIFIDSANIGEIAMWFKMGVIDGVTTNPSMLFMENIKNQFTPRKLVFTADVITSN
jgi:transaldolase